MKVLALVTFVVLAVAVNAANQCPKEQEYDWEIEMLLEHEDCDKFYKCTYGQPVEKLCPGDLFFNLELWQCDWRNNVDCGDRNVPDDGQGGGGGDGGAGGGGGDGGGEGDGGDGGGGGDGSFDCDDVPIKIPDFEVLDNGCPVNASIHWLLPHESNCNQFYYCIGGELSIMNCPSTLHFNTYLQVCDFPQNACCVRSSNKHLSG